MQYNAVRVMRARRGGVTISEPARSAATATAVQPDTAKREKRKVLFVIVRRFAINNSKARRDEGRCAGKDSELFFSVFALLAAGRDLSLTVAPKRANQPHGIKPQYGHRRAANVRADIRITPDSDTKISRK